MGLFRRPKVAPDDLAFLREWVASHGGIGGGVEGYVEPQTSVTPTTIVLVAGDGEFVRRRIGSPHAAAKFARAEGIPIYHADRVGLPRRMREYVLRQQADQDTTSGRQPTRTALEWDAIGVIAAAASLPVPTDAGDEALRELWRAARSRAHPDRNAGDRTQWDAVEDAAHALGLR